MSAELQIDRAALDDERTLVAVTGSLDVHTSGPLRAAMLEVVEEGAITVVADLSAVLFVDSAGFSALLAGARRLHARGGRLALVTTDDSVIRMLRIMGLLEVMPVFDTPDEAWAGLQPSA